MTALSPVERAEALGHTVESDPPHALPSMPWWTCTVCGAAVMVLLDGVVSGSAITKTCAFFAPPTPCPPIGDPHA